MITVYCILFAVGFKAEQRIEFTYTPAEASAFAMGYGKSGAINVPELQRLTCQDIEHALAFEEDHE